VVAALDTPLLLMTGQNEVALKLAVADPDLRLKKWGHNMSFMPRDIVHAEGRAHTATVTLNGEWELTTEMDGIKAKATDGKTDVKIKLQHGLTRELLFRTKVKSRYPWNYSLQMIIMGRVRGGIYSMRSKRIIRTCCFMKTTVRCLTMPGK